MPLRFLFISMNLDNLGLLLFQIIIIISCSSSFNIDVLICIGITLNLYSNLGNIFIFIMLIPPTHEQGMFFYFHRSSSITFWSVLKFSYYRSFTFLHKFNPKNLINLETI